MRKKFLLMTFLTLLFTAMGTSVLRAQESYVAKVGDTEYATIDDAIANWTNNTTLTLLADVTLSDVVTINSTEHHILNLSTYTMTAASGKNAFVIKACGTGDAERNAITINADATNPGGINAGSKCVVYYKYADGGISGNDRPIIKINGGVFTGSTSSWGTAGIYTIGTAARKCATLNISGGTFNCSINGSGKSKLLVSGGVFNYSVGSQGDQTCYRLISGGTFKSFGFMTADSNNTKFWIGTSMANSDVGAYIDDNGYLVVGGPVVTEPGTNFEASSPNHSNTGFSYLTYSSVATNGIYYTSVEEALTDNNKSGGSVTVYVDELDMADFSSYKGTIVVPEESIITITNAPEGLKVTDAEGNVIEPNADGSYTTIVPDYEGEGTETSPYTIADIDDLNNLRNKVNEGETYDGKYFELTSDITLTGEWTPIGNGSRSSKTYTGNSFKGVFDGKNNIISGLTITSTTAGDAAIGLFGVVDDGTVKNLNLTDVNIKVHNSDLAGAAIGMMLNGATADYITVSGTIIGHDGVGGIVGRLIIDGTISNCINNASVTSSYGGIGGIVGKAYYEDGANTSTFASVTKCTNKGTITAPMYVGGIVGLARANVTECVNEGEVVGGTQTGGIIGQLIAAGTVSANENKAKISGTNHLGGIIGDYSQSTAYTYYNVLIANNINRGELAATEQCAAIMGCNNIDGFTAMTATGNVSYYYVEGLELFGNPEDMVIDETNKFIVPVAKIGDVEYSTLAEAVAEATEGETITMLADAAEDVTIPAGVSFNGNGKAVGNIIAAGTITFNGHTKATSFNVENTNTTVNIVEGACLEITGAGRMVIGHGCTFNITGTIAEAKTANVAELTPSLIMPGASFTGAGVTLNVTNAYISAPSSYCSSSSSASGTFDFNITNSIWESAGKLAFESQSTAATVNFELKDSKLTTGSHLVFGVSRGEVVIDNSNVNVGTSRQIENQSTMTVKNGSVVNGAVATSSNAKNPGTLIVDNATYAVTGEFSGSDLGTGTLIIKKGANVSVGSIKAGANVVVDAEGMAAGDEINFTANLSQFTGTLSVINNDNLEAKIIDGKIVLVEKPVAKIGETEYATLQEALNAAAETEELTTIQLLAGTHTFGNVKFPATLKNVTIVGADNKATIIKDSKLNSADGNAVTYKGITFDGIVFDNSGILFTGARSGEVVYEDWTIKNCDFRNLQSTDGIAAIHFNLLADETIKNFTFEKNTITNVTSPSNTASGLRLNYVTGNVVIKDNETNNVAFNAVQIINSEVDNFTFEGNILRSNGSSLANLYNVTGENIVITKNQFLANENQRSVSNIAYADVSGNYWGGGAPANLPEGVVYSSYYTTVESDGTLGGLVELPQGNNFTGYTGVDAIWGEVWGNAKESFVIKVLNANGENGDVMGTTSLINVDGIIDGDVNVTWSLKLDAESNTDEYWAMEWTAAPSIDNMPAKVELWVDGVKVSGGNVVLNGPDNLNMIYAAVTDADGKILSYHTSIAAAVAAAQQGNTIALLRDTDEEIKLPFGVTLNLNGFDAPNVTFTLPTAMIGETEYASVADALAAAQAANLADVVITIIGENTAATADNFNLVYKNKFDKVTFKQNNGGKVYYFNELYTGSRTNNGEFVFDGVNLVVTGQYMFEGNVKLSNNSFVKSTAEANCFVYNAEVTVEAGSKIDGVIEDIRGGSLIIDGGKTDGTYCSEPGLRDAILTVNWTSSNLVLKNGAYVKVNSANEVGRLTVNGEMRVTDSKLESYQWIQVNENATLTLNAGSDITTQEVNGAGNIIVDVTGLEGQATVIKGDMTGFTGTITVDRGFYTVTADGLVVERGLSGKGTEAEPYLITDADELHLFRQSVNAGETRYNTSDVWVVLNADIDLDVTRSASNWEPIGTFDYSFDGNFDGKGHIIKNLKIYDNTTAANGEAYLGFFGVTANNTIKNFVIENVTIESEGQIVAAAIAYPYYTEVSDITVKGDIKIKGGNYTAGVLAYTRLCQKASNLTVSGNEGSYIEGAQTVGGVIADIQMNHGLVANYSNFTAEGLTIKGTKSVGGISGIIAAQTLNGATVNNVTLNCEDDRVGIVSGSLGGASTITNVTVDNVTGATNIIGATYDGAKPIAAKIGDTYYGTLANALAADGEESVELLAPITIAVGETVVYNLNGKTVVATDNATGNYAMITNKGNLTIEGEGKLQLTATNNRGWSAYSSVISNTVGGKLTVNGGTIEHLGGTDMAYAIDNLTNGQGTYAETVINGGTMKSTYRAIRQFLNGVEAQNILTVTGGTIEGANKSIWMQDPSANANTGTLTVGVDAKLVGDAYLTVTAGSTEWPVEVAIAAAALQGESTVLTSNVPENYIVKNNNGVWGVFSAVASVNGVNYATLIEAVDAVEDGGTITLIANETFTENNRYNNGGWWDGLGYSGDKSFTIDLANFTISQDGALNDYLMWFKNDGAKANTITLKNGTLDAGTTAYCALATASSNAQKITVNLENIKVINNNSNGSTVKVRAGAELNVKAGTEITGKDSYLGIECWAATVNIYDGAKIYMNGTSSYNGCLAGVGGNGTINVYGGEGKGVSGGFIAMTSGGTINVEGGEWIANNDGTYANSNKSVLVAQSDKQYNAGAGNSIVNVTGGTFKGGYNCYGNAAGDAQINISGGNFNADPSAYVVANYKAVEKADGTYDVIQIAGTQTRELPDAGWYWFSTYIKYNNEETALDKLQAALGSNASLIKGQNAFTQYLNYYGTNFWTSDLTTLSTAKMYMIKTKADNVTVNLTGSFEDYANTNIELKQGWNWIGYPINEAVSLNDAIPTEALKDGDVIKDQTSSARYYVDFELPNGNTFTGWDGSLTEMKPGQGYMFKSVNEKTFSYTTSSNGARSTLNTVDYSGDNHWFTDATQYPNNMNIVAMMSIDGEIVKGNYEVAAFANGECRGSARPIYIEALDAYVLYMTIHGEDVAELTFKYYDVNYGTEYELDNRLTYSSDAILGSLKDPYIFTMNILGIGENSIDNINIYPNPTTTDREINLQAICDKVEVFNALGVKVAEYHNVDTLDALETAGIYVIRITNDNAVKHCRLVVK